MDKLFELISEKMGNVLVIILGLVAPGVLTIFILDKNTFITIDFVKFIIVSIAISMPSVIILFIGKVIQITLKDNENKPVKNSELTLENKNVIDALNSVLIDNFICFCSVLGRQIIVCDYSKRKMVYILMSITIIISVIRIISSWIKYNSVKVKNFKDH